VEICGRSTAIRKNIAIVVGIIRRSIKAIFTGIAIGDGRMQD